MLKKYFDEKGYVVGLSCGEITDNFSDMSSMDELHSLSYMLENKPNKNGFITHIVDGSSESFYSFNYDYEEIPQSQLSEEVLKEVLKEEIFNAVTIEPMPRAEKEGYKLVPKVDGTSIYWEFEKEENETDSENPTGGFFDPFSYEDGMEIISGKWYSVGDDVWEAIKDGVPTAFADKEYFDVV